MDPGCPLPTKQKKPTYPSSHQPLIPKQKLNWGSMGYPTCSHQNPTQNRSAVRQGRACSVKDATCAAPPRFSRGVGELDRFRGSTAPAFLGAFPFFAAPMDAAALAPAVFAGVGGSVKLSTTKRTLKRA
jgi:hypothetical protein